MIAAARWPEDPVLASIDPPFRILFLGTRDTVRSPIAEALMRVKGGYRFEVHGAGIRPDRVVHPVTLEVLAAAGVEARRTEPRSVHDLRDEEWDIVLAVCERGREECPTLPGHPLTGCWGIDDPLRVPEEERARAFRRTVQYLARRIDLMLALPVEMQKRIVARTRGLLAG